MVTAIKMEKNYEIETSIRSKNGYCNFVQIRPDHCTDYYIFYCCGLWEGDIGRAYILKTPSEDEYKLIPQFGGYSQNIQNCAQKQKIIS